MKYKSNSLFYKEIEIIPGSTEGGLKEIFGGWGGDLDGYDNPAAIYVDGLKNVIAYFLHADPPPPTPTSSPPPPDYSIEVIIIGALL